MRPIEHDKGYRAGSHERKLAPSGTSSLFIYAPCLEIDGYNLFESCYAEVKQLVWKAKRSKCHDRHQPQDPSSHVDAIEKLHVILHHLYSLEHLLILLVSVRADYTSLRDTCWAV